MFIDKEIEITWMSNNRKHFESKGYQFTGFFAKFMVKIEDLQNGCKKQVTCKCDFCGKIFKKSYSFLVDKIKHSCGDKKCSLSLRKLKCLQQYGVEHVLQSEEIKEKGKRTCLEKYGVEKPMQCKRFVDKAKLTYQSNFGKKLNPEGHKNLLERVKQTRKEKTGYEHNLQNPECMKKFKNTMKKRYSVEHSCQNKEIKKKLSKSLKKTYKKHNNEIQEKRRKTCLEKYDVDNVAKNEQIKEKMSKNIKTAINSEQVKNKRKETMKKRYGVEFPIQNAMIRKKIICSSKQTMHDNKTAPSSKQQQHICNLMNGEINVPLGGCLLDVVINNIVIEYDGGGHNLSVKLNKISQAEFDRKEKRRENFIISSGFKLIRYKTSKDKLFSDDKLINLFNVCKNYLSTTCHHWIYINVDMLCIESKELNCKLDSYGNILT